MAYVRFKTTHSNEGIKMTDKTPEFVDGLIVKAPRDGAPDFVKMSISIKRADLGNWLRGKTDEWINIDVKESKGGKWYCAVNNWKPEQQSSGSNQGVQTAPIDPDFDDLIPF